MNADPLLSVPLTSIAAIVTVRRFVCLQQVPLEPSAGIARRAGPLRSPWLQSGERFEQC